MLSRHDKAFFGISIAAIMVLVGFSYSDNLLPEADAAKYAYWPSSPSNGSYDYFVYEWADVSPGRTGVLTVGCNDDDELMNVRTRSYASYTSDAYIYASYNYSSADSEQTDEGNYIYKKVAYGRAANIDDTNNMRMYVYA